MSKRRVAGRFLLASVAPCGLAVMAFAVPGPSGPERVSVGVEGAEADAGSDEGAVTGNGRFVAFGSSATNLLGQATSGHQIFVRDRQSGTTLLASHNAAGAGGDDDSYDSAISDNGQFVVFSSTATDLVAGDGNGEQDIFLADMVTGEVTRISEPPGGGDPDDRSWIYGASISKNGQFIVYYSGASTLATDDGNTDYDVFLFDRLAGTTTLVSRNAAGDSANGDSYSPSISPNGRFIAYYSYATDLVEGDAADNDDVFVYDVKMGTTTKASPGMDGAEANGDSYDPVVSDNGRSVAFYSSATNLVANDTNAKYDIFLFDRKKGAMRRVSVAADGSQTTRDSISPAMSSNGKVLVFTSEAANLSPADANGESRDVFRVDPKKGAVTLLSMNADGEGGDRGSNQFAPGLSSNGRYLAFSSSARNLVTGDENLQTDLYLIRMK